MSTRTEETIQSRDGTKLFIRKFMPPSDPIARVVMIHGFLEHGGRYQEVAEYFASEHGISSVIYDVRGHGKSSGQRAYASSIKDYFDDFDVVMENAKKMHGSLPLFVLAHSFGGLTFLDYARDKKLDINGAIVISPFVEPAKAIPPIKVFLGKVLGSVLPRVSIPGEDLALTHDADKQREHDEDPMILHSVTLGWGYLCLNAQARVRETVPLSLSMPILYMMADEDSVSSPEAMKTVGNNIEQKDKTVVVRKGEYHEILNEVNRQDAYSLIAEWMCNRLTS